MGLKRSFALDVKDVWQDLASRIGATFDPGPHMNLRPRLVLTHGRRDIVVDVHSPGTAGIQDDDTRLRTMLLGWQPFAFEIRSRMIWDSARRLLGSKSPASGCPAIDRRCAVTASDPERLRALVSRPRICATLSGRKHMLQLAAIDAEETSNENPPRPVWVLCYREAGHVRDADVLMRLLLLFVEALEVLEPQAVEGAEGVEALAARWGVG